MEASWFSVSADGVVYAGGAGLIAAFVVGAVLWRLRERRREREAVRVDTPHDDTLRAGVPADQTPESAALRAEGGSAWMRPTL
ncbi:hypothetical protein [Microbacterium sp. NPDC096154]|uniref:hypothetical protein n=1 Tax=Microbacterium sp. NPDC096154 TaxID=3155549 RepID=UPI0033346135